MYNSIPKQFIIVDNRPIKFFKTKTFNGYKKAQVLSELQKNILSGNIEKSTLWATELHCSGCTEKLYNKLFSIYIKDINKANLNMLSQFVEEFYKFEIINNNTKDKLVLRNNQYIRNHIHNLIAQLTFSPKYKLPKFPKISSEDFNMKNHKKNLLTKNLNIIQHYLKEDDNKNIIIPLSEIYHNLKRKSISKSLENCIFWLNWILIYEKNYHKGYINCATRNIKNINKKYLEDFVWIIWLYILDISKKNQYILNLYKLFKNKYNKSKKRSKCNLLIIAFIIIINPFPKINYDYKLLKNDRRIMINLLSNINFQYLDVMQNQNQGLKLKKLNYPSLIKQYNDKNTIFSKQHFKSKVNLDGVINKFKKTPTILVKSKKNNELDKIQIHSKVINNIPRGRRIFKKVCSNFRHYFTWVFNLEYRN